MQGLRARVERTGVVCRGCVQGLRARVAHAGVARKGCMRRGGGETHQSLEPIRVVHAGVVGTLNQSV